MLWLALQGLEAAIIDHRVRLVILDSAASLARADFAPGSLTERQRMLGQQARDAAPGVLMGQGQPAWLWRGPPALAQPLHCCLDPCPLCLPRACGTRAPCPSLPWRSSRSLHSPSPRSPSCPDKTPAPLPCWPPCLQAARLKYLAEAFRIPVLVTNQASAPGRRCRWLAS